MVKILEGKRALVSGAGGRIGLATIEELQKQGAEVVGLEYDKEAVKRLNNEGVVCHQINLMEESGFEKVQEIVDSLPQLDILVNCVGGISRAPFLEHDPEEFKRLWLLNVYSVMRTSQIVCNRMAKQKKGRIINFAAVGAVRPTLNHSGYCTAKAALVAFSRTLALEMAPYGITVNVIAPGPTETIPPTSPYYQEHPEIHQSVLQKTPQGRLGTPEDHMGLLTYFASDRSSWVTGQIVMSDGGLELA